MGSVVNKFPCIDVTIDILLRLSVKSLLRFRCVCKTWCNLLKSPNFIDMHFNHPRPEKDHHVLIKRCVQEGKRNWLSIHSNTESLSIVLANLRIRHLNNEYVQLLGPCNGLICLTDYEIIILGNPATREFMRLPPRPFGCPQDLYYTNSGVGFGFDINTNDYKVVRIINLVDDDDYTFNIYKAEVYRHSTNSWRDVDYALPNIWYRDCFEIFFNGATHWYARRKGIEKVLSFNIATETFQEFDFPDHTCHFGDGNSKSLTVLNEFLALIYYTGPRVRIDQQFINIVSMTKYGVSESWTKQFTIGPLSEIQHPITTWNNSSLLLEKTNGQLISCGLHSQEVMEFDIVSYPTTLRALIYRESLVSIKPREYVGGVTVNLVSLS